jgi:hypothetical protein
VTKVANPIALGIGHDRNGYIANASTFFKAKRVLSDDEFYQELSTASGHGCKPITIAAFVGHSWSSSSKIGGAVGNNSAYFDLGTLSRRQRATTDLVSHVGQFYWQNDLQLAANCKFSFPCWFTVDASVAFVGCITNSLARSFARTVLRNGGSAALGTTKPTWAYSPVEMAYGKGNGNGQYVDGVEQLYEDPTSQRYKSPDEYLKSFTRHGGKN